MSRKKLSYIDIWPLQGLCPCLVNEKKWKRGGVWLNLIQNVGKMMNRERGRSEGMRWVSLTQGMIALAA